jgi:aminodeoxyfutalosine synthase
MEYQRDSRLNRIREEILEGNRLEPEDGHYLFMKAPLGFLSDLAEKINDRKSHRKVYFNRNFHLEPTNICVHNCLFCSYSRKINQEGAWDLSQEQMLQKIDRHGQEANCEVHIVGGVHPSRDLDYYIELLKEIKSRNNKLVIKAFTAVELDFMFRKSKVSPEEGLSRLKDAGLEAIPGGGGEIFDEDLRQRICPDKTDSKTWLEIHETAHHLGIPTNATMLYGHYETYGHRIDHLDRLRKLQDKTHGFQVFIPLKYRHYNNPMSDLGELNTIEDLRNYAISRIFLDNFDHLKAYWPMIGKEVAGLSLSFGVDDLDGTIEDTTKIYSMAGVEDQNPSMTTAEIIELIKKADKIPVERDTFYREIKVY